MMSGGVIDTECKYQHREEELQNNKEQQKDSDQGTQKWQMSLNMVEALVRPEMTQVESFSLRQL